MQWRMIDIENNVGLRLYLGLLRQDKIINLISQTLEKKKHNYLSLSLSRSLPQLC